MKRQWRRVWKPWAVVVLRSPYGHEVAFTTIQRDDLIRMTYRFWTRQKANNAKHALRVRYPFAAVRVKRAVRLR